jgi:hypothetical protein
MSTDRKKNDARRFGFCLRCLAPVSGAVVLQEHHIRGRKTLPSSIVFICEPCHSDAEGPEGPITRESDILENKNALLISSSSLLFVIENRANIIGAFQMCNRDAPSTSIGPGGIMLLGHLGAVGYSGKRYYLVPPDKIDMCVSDPSDTSCNQDGIGGPAGNFGWVRFQGGPTHNVLAKFIDLHTAQGNPGESLEALRQD